MAPADAGVPPDPGTGQEPSLNEERIRELERQLGQLDSRKADIETVIRSGELLVSQLEEIVRTTGDPVDQQRLDDAIFRLNGSRQELTAVNGQIDGVRQQIARLRRGLTEDVVVVEPPAPPAANEGGGPSDAAGPGPVEPPAHPAADEGGTP